MVYRVGVFGSRSIPDKEATNLYRVGKALAAKKLQIETSADEGAIEAVKLGVEEEGLEALALVREWLPCSGYKGSDSPHFPPSPQAMELAQKFHPKWELLSLRTKRVMGRMTHILLGEDCRSPVTFAVHWVLPGREGDERRYCTQGIRICRTLDIPHFNVALPSSRGKLYALLRGAV